MSLPISSNFTPSTRFDTQVVAQDALEKRSTQNLDHKHLLADRYLKAIEEHGHRDEQTLARIVRKELSYWNPDVATIAFKMLSKPISVPIGPALATMGMKLYCGIHSRTETAEPFLRGIVENGTEPEKLFTQCAREACHNLYDTRATEIQQSALEKISQGLARPLKDELLDFGQHAVQLSEGEGDAGLPYLTAFEKFGSPQEQRFVAETRAVMKEVSLRYDGLGTMAFQAACQGLQGPLGLAMTRLAAQASETWFRSSPLCRAFLGSIERTIENSEDRLLAQTALKVTDGIQDLTKTSARDRDRQTIEILSSAVFDQILAGGSYLDGKLAQLGGLVTSEFVHQSDTDNQRSRLVLQTLAENASIPANQKIAQEALEKTAGPAPLFFKSRKFARDVEIHRQAYQEILSNSKQSYIDAHMKTCR
jgi:hypothetical protein